MESSVFRRNTIRRYTEVYGLFRRNTMCRYMDVYGLFRTNTNPWYTCILFPDIHFRTQLDPELLINRFNYFLRQVPYFFSTCTTTVNQHQCLMLIASCISNCLPFPSVFFYKPTRRYFYIELVGRIPGQIFMAFL